MKVTHLGFEFNLMSMEVHLPPNKKLCALRAVHYLLTTHSVTFAALEEVLGFLSHCCQVIPLGRPYSGGSSHSYAETKDNHSSGPASHQRRKKTLIGGCIFYVRGPLFQSSAYCTLTMMLLWMQVALGNWWSVQSLDIL